MHIADLAEGMSGANGIVGGGPPLACGAALSAKRLGTGGVAVTFVGDGGANQGTTLESLNLASIWKLPCIFVIQNNGYGARKPRPASIQELATILPIWLRASKCPESSSTGTIFLRCTKLRPMRCKRVRPVEAPLWSSVR